MTRRFSQLVAWACAGLILAQVLLGAYALFDIGAFARLTQRTLALPIQWVSVEPTQWYALLLLTVLAALPGLAALYFLRRSFAKFARGEYFNDANSRDLRRFAVLLLAQALLRPLHHVLASVVLSVNHPPGQKLLSLSLGSHELQAIGLALVFWVLASLLLEGARLQSENRQFV
ncbi:MAG: DUF2975 domain-containing protein [Pseudomonadota bacterium]